MTALDALWQAVYDAASEASLPESGTSPKSAATRTETAKALKPRLADAIRTGSLKEVLECLEAGAAVNAKGIASPLTLAFSHNQPDIARVLVEHGGTFEVRAMAYEHEYFNLACKHHSTVLADLLLDNGYVFDEIFNRIEAMDSSPALLRWWMGHGFPIQDDSTTPNELADGHSDNPRAIWEVTTWLQQWADIAKNFLITQPGLFREMHDYLSVMHPTVGKTSGFQRCVDDMWESVLGAPAPAVAEMTKVLLESNFTPTLSFSHDPDDHDNFFDESDLPPLTYSLFWHAVGKKCLPMMTLLMKSPAIARQVRMEAGSPLHQQALLEKVPLDIPILTFLNEEVGLPVFSMTHPEQGDTVAHLQSNNLTRAFLRWAATNQPDWLWTENNEGETVFSQIHDGEKLETELSKTRLKRSLPKASRAVAHAKPAKRRL
jgi:hypothetical protein